MNQKIGKQNALTITRKESRFIGPIMVPLRFDRTCSMNDTQ